MLNQRECILEIEFLNGRYMKCVYKNIREHFGGIYYLFILFLLV